MTKQFSPYFHGKVVNGEWYFKHRDIFNDYVKNLNDGEYQMAITPKYKQRTSGQTGEETNWNGYYWGVIIEMLHEEMGLARNECHEELKILFNPKGYTNSKGDQRVYGGSTKRLSDKKFKTYCYDIRRWAMHPDDSPWEGGLYIPEPHESPEAHNSLMEANRGYNPD